VDAKVYYLKQREDPATDEVIEYVCGGCGTVWAMNSEHEPVYCPHCGDVGSFYDSGNRPCG
jgi:rubrerythrin